MTFKLAGIFVLCLLWTTISFGQNSIEKFRYQPNKVPVGTVLHYVKTNLNGSHPENIVLYIAAPDRLESFKYKSPGTRSALVKATMDWDLYCAKYLESWQMFPDDAVGEPVICNVDKTLFESLSYDFRLFGKFFREGDDSAVFLNPTGGDSDGHRRTAFS